MKGDHDITKGSISGWISYTIRLAYKKLSKSKIALLKIKAHELRALSASWSYMNKIPIERIIKAAVWSSRSPFAKFYLRFKHTRREPKHTRREPTTDGSSGFCSKSGRGPVRSFSSSMLILRDYRLSPSKTDSKVLGYDSAVSRDRVVEI